MSARTKPGYKGHGDHGHGGEHHTHPKHKAHKLVKQHTTGSRAQGQPFHKGSAPMGGGAGPFQQAGSLNDEGDSVGQAGAGMEAPEEAGETGGYSAPGDAAA